MRRIPMWRRHLRFWGPNARADVDTELACHMDELVDWLVETGLPPAEAKAEAIRRFGDYARVHAACVAIDRRWERQRRWQRLLADLGQDLRLGVGTLARDLGITTATIIILGLGFGAATVVGSVIYAVFVRPLPFPEPDRIVNVVV